jgi:hypothetical protein
MEWEVIFPSQFPSSFWGGSRLRLIPAPFQFKNPIRDEALIIYINFSDFYFETTISPVGL